MSNKESFIKLREILVHLYREQDDAERVAQDAELDISHISFSSKSINNWNAILLQAQKENKTAKLRNITSREYKDAKFDKTWHDYLQTVENPKIPTIGGQNKPSSKNFRELIEEI